jgi:hypothetical protein
VWSSAQDGKFMRELRESEQMPSDNPEILPHALRKMMLLRLG